jgi:putative transposase
MIEAFWRSLKPQWLFLNSLDTTARLRSLVAFAFFVEEHNTKMPHAAFRGLTPDEMYCGTAFNLTGELTAARKEAFEKRLAVNRSISCSRCSTPDASSALGIPP